MGLHYLKGKNWIDVTREERLFCSHLYHKINTQQKAKEFIKWINKMESPVKDFKNESLLNPEQNWEVSFESCFYRDLLKLYGHGVKEKMEELKKIEEIADSVNNLIKRTFDLVIFSDDTIVIIEAKAAGKLELKQFKEFEIDENLIKGVFKFLNIKPPKIVFYILATNTFYSSKSFTAPNGVGKMNLVEKQKIGKCKINGLISWKQLLDSEMFSDTIFSRAEDSYMYNVKRKCTNC